jgi:hypothetical protein
LSLYRRPFTVFDFGSGVEGSVGADIAAAYPNAICVLAEKDPLRYTPPPNCMVLQRTMTPDILSALSQCEYFDVGLALNILHWEGCNWPAFVTEILGDVQFVQTPYPSDTTACGQELLGEIYSALVLGADRIGETVQFEGHLPRPLFQIGKVRSTAQMLTRKTVTSERQYEVRGLLRISPNEVGVTIKLLHKGALAKWQSYIPGLTLSNFCELGGVWPDRATITTALAAIPLHYNLAARPHGDITPWNIRFDCDRMWLIDGYEGWGGSDYDNLNHTIDWVNEELKKWEI